ncbi:MAG: sigma-70 family RNA polymerase sigma factor [Pyrinomonadaceae bacterium]
MRKALRIWYNSNNFLDDGSGISRSGAEMKTDWQTKKNQVERDFLIEKHKPMVFHLAKKISLSFPFQTDMEELVAYGQLGLIEASERFDASRGYNFSTFAHYRIKGAIYDGLREMGVITRSRKVRFAAQANDVLTSEVDDSMSDSSAAVDDEIKSVETLIDALIPIYFLSIDDADTEELRDENAESAADFETRELLEKIRETLDEIDPDEAGLLRKIYFKNTRMKDLALEMGVTKSWVSRLHARAVKHLQEALRGRGILESG